MESEQFFSKAQEAEKSVDLNEEIRKIYELITKMDVGKASVETIPIKEYIEKIIDGKGELNPLRVEQLKKEVNRIYYGEFLRNKELKKETHENKDPSEIKFFKISFEGQGYKGMNFIEFYRENETSWRTSDIGRGYTTTCSSDPDWLVFEQLEKWDGIYDPDSFVDTERVYVRKKTGNIKIFGMDAALHLTDFKHITGDGHIYEFKFYSKEDADKFAESLFQKEKEREKENISPDKKLGYMRDSDELFMWSQMSFIDKRYGRLLGYGIHDEFWEKYDNPYDYTEIKQAFDEAVLEYKRIIIKKLLDLTEAVAKSAEVEARGKFKVDDFKDQKQCESNIKEHILEARYGAIDWAMIKNVLRNHEKEIMAIFDSIKKQNKEERRKELAPFVEGTNEAVTGFISSVKMGYNPESYRKLNEQIEKFTLIKDYALYESLSKIMGTLKLIDPELGPSEDVINKLTQQLKEFNGIFEKRYAT